jgi:hypothetical protein
MGDHKTVGVANVYVPNEFEIYLGTDDHQHLTSLSDSLKTELANYVTAFAGREGWTLVAPPHIELCKDEDLRVGEFGIATRTERAGRGPAPAPAAAVVPPGGGRAPGPVIDQMRPQRVPPAVLPARLSALASARPPGDSRLPAGHRHRRSRRDIVLTDPNVSRQHAEVRRQTTVSADLGSRTVLASTGATLAACCSTATA